MTSSPHAIRGAGADIRVSTSAGSTLLRSVIANWAGEGIIVASGFFLPRLISQGMSPEQLGIWDYGWTMRSYVALAGGALGSGASHYVARYGSKEQWPQLSRTMGAMLALVIYASAFAALLTGSLAYFTPWLIRTNSITQITDARSLVLSMGLASCIAMVTLVFGGTIAGGGRFDVLNLVDGLSDVLLVISLIACIFLGAGLKIMGVCVLSRELFNAVARYLSAKYTVPQLQLRPRWFDRTTFREIVGFSAKTIVETLSKTLQYQAPTLVVAAFIGPAALAVYSRPRALILIATRFVMGFARVLVPTAAIFHGERNHAGLGDLLVQSTRYAMLLALPPALLFLILGHAILVVWMGDPTYADNNVLLILVLGYLPLLAQQATYHILLGLASHGLAGTASLIGSSLGAGLSLLFVAVLGWGIEGAALAMAIPVFVVNFSILPYAGCRATGISLSHYLRSSALSPLVSVIPFAAVLLIARFWLPDDPRAQLLAGLAAGTPVLAATYWFWVVPADLKGRFLAWRWRQL